MPVNNNDSSITKYESLLIRILLLSFSILLIAVSYPGSSFPLLVIIAVAPALVAVANLRPMFSAIILGLWAWVWWLIALWWGIPSLVNFTESSLLVSTLVIGLICFSLALPYALSAFIISYFKLWQSSLAFIHIPLCFTVFITAFSSILPAAPVNALFEYPVLLQWADVGGLPLLTFFYFIANTAIASIFINKKNKRVKPILVLLILIVTVLSYGYFRLTEQDTSATKLVRIGYLQPVLSVNNNLSDLIAQTNQLNQLQHPPELIIWPEVPIDFSWQNNEYERYRLKSLAKKLNTHLFILPGYRYVNNENALSGHFNSANLISDKGENLAEYHKQILVPFFEYLPFSEQFKSYFPNVRNYVAGTKAVPFDFKGTILAPLICYEALFSSKVRPYVEEKADIIINPGNDGWFSTAGALSHLSLTLLRSIEYRMPLIRVNNSGVSTVIDQKGNILFDTLSPLGEKTEKVFEVKVTKQKSPTFYYRFSNILTVFAVLLLLILLVLRQRDLSANA